MIPSVQDDPRRLDARVTAMGVRSGKNASKATRMDDLTPSPRVPPGFQDFRARHPIRAGIWFRGW